MSKTTLLKELEESGIDWETADILVQGATGYEGEQTYQTGWESKLKNAVRITKEHPVMGIEFKTGYGGPEMPRFFAQDKEHIYFAAQYDGSTWVEKVPRDIEAFTRGATIPYPGQ